MEKHAMQTEAEAGVTVLMESPHHFHNIGKESTVLPTEA